MRRTRAAPPARVAPSPPPSLPIATGGPAAQRCFETVLVPAPVDVQAPVAGAPSDRRQRRGGGPRPGLAPPSPPGPTFLSVPVPCPGDEIGGGDAGAGLLLGGDAPGSGDTGPLGEGAAQEGGDIGAPGAGASESAGSGLGGGGDPLGALPPSSEFGDGGFGGDGPSGLPFQDPLGDAPGAGPVGSPLLAVVPDPGQANGIPEPSVLALMGMGALAIGAARRRWRQP